MKFFDHGEKSESSAPPSGDGLLRNSGSAAKAPPEDLSYTERDRMRIISALRKYGGNRQLTAGELGISTTTLWRRMQKYGIRADKE